MVIILPVWLSVIPVPPFKPIPDVSCPFAEFKLIAPLILSKLAETVLKLLLFCSAETAVLHL